MTHKKRQTTKLCKNNTQVFYHPDGRLHRVRLHSTDIVTIALDGAITLQTNGWKTFTTKTRMNQAAAQFNLGFNVYQKKHQWWVLVGDEDLPFIGHSITFSVPKTVQNKPQNVWHEEDIPF